MIMLRRVLFISPRILKHRAKLYRALVEHSPVLYSLTIKALLLGLLSSFRHTHGSHVHTGSHDQFHCARVR